MSELEWFAELDPSSVRHLLDSSDSAARRLALQVARMLAEFSVLTICHELGLDD